MLESGRPWENVKRGLLATVNEVRGFSGELVEVSMAITVPSAFLPGALDTFVVLEFERGRGALLSITGDGKNLGLTLVEFKQGFSLPAVPHRDRLIGYHIPLAQVVELQLKEEDGLRWAAVLA